MTDAMIFKERAEIAEMCISELKAEITRLKEDARTDLGNLFARIFRDGGQHAASLTHDEAMRQADLAVANYIGGTDKLKAEIARLRGLLSLATTRLAEYNQLRDESVTRAESAERRLREIAELSMRDWTDGFVANEVKDDMIRINALATGQKP